MAAPKLNARTRRRPDEAEAWTALPELRVTDPAAVQVLWHPPKRVHLSPFIGKATGLAQAAAELGVKKTAMSYWIGRLLAVGLIRACGVEQGVRYRAPLYRCVADCLVVSLADAPMSSHEGVFDDFDARWHPLSRRALAKALVRQARHIDLRIEASDTAGVATVLAPRNAAAPPDDYIYYWARMWLTAPERDALHAELDALWNKYAALSDRTCKTQVALVHLMAVPEGPR